MVSGSKILGFDVAWSKFAWPELWLKNGVFDQISGCSGQFDIALEEWAPFALNIFYRYAKFFGSSLVVVFWVRLKKYLPMQSMVVDFMQKFMLLPSEAPVKTASPSVLGVRLTNRWTNGSDNAQ